MKTPSFDIPESSLTQVKLLWETLTLGTETGGIALDGYMVYYKDEDVATWNSLISTTEHYTIIDQLTPGVYYLFKIIAFNKYGHGPDSNSLRVVAGQRPDPDTLAPVVTLSGTYVKIDWIAANDNYVDVDAYKILVRGKDG